MEQPENLINAKTPHRKTKAQVAPNAAKAAVPAAKIKKPNNAAAVSAAPQKPAAIRPSKASPRRTTAPLGRIASPLTAVPAGVSKQAHLIALLQATPGAAMDQMMTLTGWQAHTVRGTISGVLRKKLSLNVTCQAALDADDRVYRIVGSRAS